jgi:hypothetical protein
MMLKVKSKKGVLLGARVALRATSRMASDWLSLAEGYFLTGWWQYPFSRFALVRVRLLALQS